MSSYVCAVEHCKTKRGSNVSFKKFPQSGTPLSRRWLERFPSGFRPEKYSRVCSLHFHDSEYEKDREDGTRKLKQFAVPTQNMTDPLKQKPGIIIVKKRVLGDITNITNNRDHTYSIKKAQETVQSTFQTLHTPQTPRQSVKLEIPLRLQAQETVQSTLLQTPRRSVKLEIPLHSTPGRSANPGPLIPHPVRLADMASEVATPISDNYFLCEESGMILPYLQPSEMCEDVLNTTMDDFTPPVQSEALQVYKYKFTSEELLRIVEEQQARIDFLEEQSREKDRTNAALKRMHRRLKAGARMEKPLAPWLHKTQHRLLFKATKGGIKWHMDLIREGLILKMKAGSSAYSAFVNRIPLLPSLRLLQLSVQFIKFNSGILHEIFDLLEVAAAEMHPLDRDCHIVLDEMAIEKALKFCRSNNQWLGHSTFPSHKGIAGKALVIVLAGVRRRWKCAVAAYLTSSTKEEDSGEQDTEIPEEELISTGEAYKSIILQVMKKSEERGLRVSGVTSDMGPENLAFWKVFGVVAQKGKPVVSSVQNPHRNAPFFVLPDGIHLLKAIKTTTESNEIIILPPEIVESEGLRSNIVDYSHIQELYDFEAQFELKVAFRLKPENIHCNQQFSKMKMGTHRAVICHRTSVGLNLLSEEKDNAAYRTTAWFIEQLNNFFDLVTSRSRPLALSRDNEVVYEKSITLIKKMSFLFEHLKFGEQGLWKPCQRGMMVLCNSLLGLQNQFLSPVGDYKFLSLGRFLSDCVENLISLIRLRQPIPNAVAFFQNLKVITLSQLSEAVKGSGYDYEEADRLPGLDMLEIARQKSQERAELKFYESLEEMVIDPNERVSQEEIAQIGSWELRVFYDMAGSVLHSIQKANVTVCFVCLDAAQWQGEEAHPQAKVTVSKEYYAFRGDCTTALQMYPSDEVFKAILIAELTFRKFRARSMHLSTANAEMFFVENLMYVWSGSSLPDCHQIGRKILHFFIKTRFQQYSSKIKQTIKDAQKKKAPRRNSKSCGMRDSANLMTIRPKKKSPTNKKISTNKKAAKKNPNPNTSKKPANKKKSTNNENKKPKPVQPKKK